MDEQLHRVAAQANALAYDDLAEESQHDGSPHLKHAELRRLYRSLLDPVLREARAANAEPRVLDLGGGDGSVSFEWMREGARVCVVDVSAQQIERLRRNHGRVGERLRLICRDAFDAMRDLRGEEFEVVLANSFLHHIPDYLRLAREAVGLLAPGGWFFSFQDPIRYDTLGRCTRLYAALAYGSWRVFQGDVLRGVARRIRRSRGVYTDDPADNVEYHVTRGGVDPDAIQGLLSGLGCEARIVRYFSTQVALWQRLGSAARLANTFAVVARKGGR